MKELGEYEKSLVKWIRRTRPTVYTVCNHVSSSGMFRLISAHVIRKGQIISLNCLAEHLDCYKRDKRREGLRVGGCGMDMGFAVVYSISGAIFPKGFRYRKNEHHRNGSESPTDCDGGYALRQQWM